MHNAWEHIKILPGPAARSPTPMIYEDKGQHVNIENGRIAPPPTPEQEQEVPEKIVQELRNLEQATEKIKEQQITMTDSTEQPMDLNEISSEDLITFDILILTCCYCKILLLICCCKLKTKKRL